MTKALVRAIECLPGVHRVCSAGMADSCDVGRAVRVRFAINRSAEAWASLELLSGICTAYCLNGDPMWVDPAEFLECLDPDFDGHCFEMTCRWQAETSHSPADRVARTISLAMQQPWSSAA